MAKNNLDQVKKEEIEKLIYKVENKIIEKSNLQLLSKLINNASSISEVLAISALGTTCNRTGLQFDKRLETVGDDIRYLEKDSKLSFGDDDYENSNMLIIGDNYPALLNLLITHKGKVDIIYIDPPYALDSENKGAEVNYNNRISRDNLLSMLYPRLILARELLSSEGVIFCSIDDRNHSYVKCLFDEVFGENCFLLNCPRITKKGGKSTKTIAKNNDYIIGYTTFTDIIFSQEEKDDLDKYKYSDEHEDERGKYALTQTLDYNSLQYSEGMDYEIEIDGQKFYPGGSKEEMKKRHNGKHGITDWVWRWSKDAVEWGKKNDMFVIKNNRIYTKSYLKCRKKRGSLELEFIDPAKAYTTLSYMDNKYSNDNGKKEFDKIFEEDSKLFKNPKPSVLISELIKMVSYNKNATILDFYAGSGTTGQAVLKLNKEDGGNRHFILCTNNDITDVNPNGIAIDVTTERLKRVMTGKTYSGKKNFKWISDNEPLGGTLNVYWIKTIRSNQFEKNKTPFDIIDEKNYGEDFTGDAKAKVNWVCSKFERTLSIAKDEK